MNPDPLLPQTGLLHSIQVGRPRDMVLQNNADQRPQAWRSAIFKSPVEGPVSITPAGIDGDTQTDLVNHGGPDNVVLAYDGGHYPHWRVRLELPELAFGSFGENFTVTGFSDDTVCIGDTWHVGPDLILQISQPRQPCYKLARRLQRLEVVQLVRENGWGGWYLRVLRPGVAQAGMAITRVGRLHPEWTAARAIQTMYSRKVDPARARILAGVPELSARWKRELLQV